MRAHIETELAPGHRLIDKGFFPRTFPHGPEHFVRREMSKMKVRRNTAARIRFELIAGVLIIAETIPDKIRQSCPSLVTTANKAVHRSDPAIHRKTRNQGMRRGQLLGRGGGPSLREPWRKNCAREFDPFQ